MEHTRDSRNVIGTCNRVHETYDLDLKLKDPQDNFNDDKIMWMMDCTETDDTPGTDARPPEPDLG